MPAIAPFGFNGAASLQVWRVAKAQELRRKSDRLVAYLSLRMELIGILWVALATSVVLSKIALARLPINGPWDLAAIALPYLFVIVAPVLGYWSAAGSFPRGLLAGQPRFRLAFYGRWRQVSVLEARRDPGFGPTGFMASLLVGLMLNVPIRLLEFVGAVPAMNSHAPVWGQTLFLAMAAEVCVMSFLYMACFVMALRSIPLFPRLLAFTWAADAFAQLTIAELVTRSDTLPVPVAAALQDLLMGNIKKVMISVIVWLPYLLLSQRVNLTYRCRVPADLPHPDSDMARQS